MRLFVSWYQGDPEYQKYDPSCHLLISPTNVSKTWDISKFKKLPKVLMIDSGAFHFIEKDTLTISQEEIYKRQLEIKNNTKITTIFTQLDFPIPPRKIPSINAKKRVEITIQNARIFLELFDKYKEKRDRSLGVIQGYDTESLIFSAENMKDLGFDLYGIGSIAKISKHNREEIKTRIKLVKNIVNKRLHVFGVTSIDLMQFFKEIGVYSIDSTTPIKEAIYSGIIYSNPFRRFKISTKHFRDEWSKKYGFSNILNTPLKCNCPVCNLDPELIMKRGKKVLNNLRAVHNYYHLKKLIEDY